MKLTAIGASIPCVSGDPKRSTWCSALQWGPRMIPSEAEPTVIERVQRNPLEYAQTIEIEGLPTPWRGWRIVFRVGWTFVALETLFFLYLLSRT